MVHDFSYSNLVARILSTLCTSSPFMIKCLLPNECLKYLITITRIEDLANVVEEKEEFNTSHKSTSCLHFFVLPKTPNSTSEKTLKKLLGALIKINAAKCDVTRSSTNSGTHCKRIRSPQNHTRKRRHNAWLSPKKLDMLKQSFHRP